MDGLFVPVMPEPCNCMHRCWSLQERDVVNITNITQLQCNHEYSLFGGRVGGGKGEVYMSCDLVRLLGNVFFSFYTYSMLVTEYTSIYFLSYQCFLGIYRA